VKVPDSSTVRLPFTLPKHPVVRVFPLVVGSKLKLLGQSVTGFKFAFSAASGGRFSSSALGEAYSAREKGDRFLDA